MLAFNALIAFSYGLAVDLPPSAAAYSALYSRILGSTPD
jgi:hypothetical protein